jgi:hypothetical protein
MQTKMLVMILVAVILLAQILTVSSYTLQQDQDDALKPKYSLRDVLRSIYAKRVPAGLEEVPLDECVVKSLCGIGRR